MEVLVRRIDNLLLTSDPNDENLLSGCYVIQPLNHCVRMEFGGGGCCGCSSFLQLQSHCYCWNDDVAFVNYWYGWIVKILLQIVMMT